MLHVFFLISLISAVAAYRLIRVPHAHYFSPAGKAAASFINALAAFAAGLLTLAALLTLSL